jgi:hypothetical protein
VSALAAGGLNEGSSKERSTVVELDVVLVVIDVVLEAETAPDTCVTAAMVPVRPTTAPAAATPVARRALLAGWGRGMGPP